MKHAYVNPGNSQADRRARAEGLHATEPSAAAFHRVFLLTVPFMVVALALGLVIRGKPLSQEMVEIAEGKVEAPQY